MKRYPQNSALTIKQRIENAYRQKRTHDLVITVYANDSDYEDDWWFYLSDWESKNPDGSYEFQNNPMLSNRLDTECQTIVHGNKCLMLGYDSRQGAE